MRCYLIDAYKLNHILVKDISFSKGKWFGTFEGLVTKQLENMSVNIPFTYDRTWHLHAFKYPKNLSENELTSLKSQFQQKLPNIQDSLYSLLIEQREKSVPPPQIHSFQIDEELTTNELILATFCLVNTNERFFANIQLLNNEWVYKFSTKNELIDYYKTHYQWEDDLYDAVVAEIEKNAKQRLRFILHLKKYKYK